MFPLPLSVLMVLEEDRQRQLERLACPRRTVRSECLAPQRSPRPLGRGATWANLFGRRRRDGVAAASLAAH
jgi:hypothetical protein